MNKLYEITISVAKWIFRRLILGVANKIREIVAALKGGK
jgi:hypothetical protein